MTNISSNTQEPTTTEISNMQYFSTGSWNEFYFLPAGTIYQLQVNVVTIASWGNVPVGRAISTE